MSRKREEKISTGYTVKADSATGILKAYVSIFGIEDDSWFNDIIEPGAFKKTIAERGPGGSNKIRVLWMHAIREVIGRSLLIEEHPRDLLPEHIREKYPLASGGLYTETQLVMDVQRAREAFALYRDGAMDEWSIGFDAIDERWEEIDKRQVRRLREIKLWEYSPVTWGANPATATVEVKNKVLALLDRIKSEHPEYDDRQLLQAAERRIAPEPDSLVRIPNEKPEEKTQVPVEINLKQNDALKQSAAVLLEETNALFAQVKAEHPDYGDLQLIQAVEKRLSETEANSGKTPIAADNPATEPAPQVEAVMVLNSSLLALLNEIKAEHPEFDDLQLIQAVEERLSPKQDVIEPEPDAVVAKRALVATEPTAPPLVNTDEWKQAASRRIRQRELELSLMRGKS